MVATAGLDPPLNFLIVENGVSSIVVPVATATNVRLLTGVAYGTPSEAAFLTLNVAAT